MSDRFEINIDQIEGTSNYSVEVSDHLTQVTKILDNAYNNTVDANKAAQKYINEIGARRQLGGKQSSKLSPSVSKAECVGSIPTALAKLNR